MRRFFSHPLILSFLIIAIFVFANQQSWLKATKDGFFKLISPGQRAVYQISLRTRNFADFILSVREMEENERKLQEENRAFLGQVGQLEEVLRENEFLRKQIGLPIPGMEKLILASIIGREPSGLGEYILIDKGERDGLMEKDTVITSGNLLVGQVVETAESFSKVRLITDPNSRINVLIQKSGVIGLTESKEGIDLVLGLLPQGELVEEGELVVTSGLAGLFPPGLVIGQIEKIVSSDAQTSQRAKLKPAVDFGNLTRVFIVK